MGNIKVLILAGGKGARLSEETVNKPKPMISIGDKPILWHIMKLYSNHGFNDFVILLGYKGYLIKEYFEKEQQNNWNITYIDTGLETKKSERILMAKEFVKEDNFFVAYGDDLSDVNPTKILDFHITNKKIVTLTAVPLESNFGILKLEDLDVIEFKEKPIIKDHWINGGFFCFSSKIFNYLNDKEELEDQVFKYLAEKKEIIAYKHFGFWKSMNTFKDTLELNTLWNNNNAPWK